ncbi:MULTISPECIES: hypothetical protein [unclassified Streptomyces]|uniref:hypothetical protein n=1 Tax=unclassified Streptomyces TaxID=2593676 RepID=UPI002E13E04C|nr:hypothetical protein OG457_11970 [Streptomyces sp. NBC_01207]WTA17764.1 hypothetical protein OG365_06660 [Streptomyces sp. NBC_00853]
MSPWNHHEQPAPSKERALGEVLASGHAGKDVEHQLGRLLVHSNTSLLNAPGSFAADDEEFIEDWADAFDGWGLVEEACRRLLIAGEALTEERRAIRVQLAWEGRPKREAFVELPADRPRRDAQAALARALGDLADLYVKYPHV